MEVKRCKCGSAYMEYKVIGEDLWEGIPHNTTRIKANGIIECVCNSCLSTYDTYDPFMVEVFSKEGEGEKIKSASGHGAEHVS